MNKETALQNKMMLALSDSGVLVFRNNVGEGWHGKVIHQGNGTVTLANAYKIPYGLCVGSSDLICCAPVVITADMVGETIGVFVAPEVKTETGKLRTPQKAFINAVRLAGGRAGIARTVEEAIALALK